MKINNKNNMSKHDENIMPDDYWNDLSETEKDAMFKAMQEAEEFFANEQMWEEMDDQYYDHLRERFGKGPDEIGPREFKSFKSVNMPFWMIVIPAGRQHDGNTMVQYFHTILEDMEEGECNGSYELITESELESKFNIKYNN